jgi:hypothetical protein
MYAPTVQKGVRISPVSAVIARALYGESKDIIQGFVDILCEGLANRSYKGSKAAVLLRDYLITTDQRLLTGSGAGDITYRLTETALRAYVDNKSLTKLAECEEELFPLPRNKRKYEIKQSEIKQSGKAEVAIGEWKSMAGLSKGSK